MIPAPVVMWAWVVTGAGVGPNVQAIAPTPDGARERALSLAREWYTDPEDVGLTLDEVLAEVAQGQLVFLAAPSKEVAEVCAERLLVA